MNDAEIAKVIYDLIVIRAKLINGVLVDSKKATSILTDAISLLHIPLTSSWDRRTEKIPKDRYICNISPQGERSQKAVFLSQASSASPSPLFFEVPFIKKQVSSTVLLASSHTCSAVTSSILCLHSSTVSLTPDSSLEA